MENEEGRRYYIDLILALMSPRGIPAELCVEFLP